MTQPDWQSAIDIHPAGWACPAEPFWIAGWVASTAGLVPVDLRAWLGERPFLGLCGLPRPDREIAVRGRDGLPHAGFSFLLQPVTGARWLRIEVCDQFGRWIEIIRQAVTASGSAADPPRRPADPATLLRLLRAHHARPDQPWNILAAEILAAESSATFQVLPSPPFHGALEQLADTAAVQYDHLLVTGWIAHREQRIERLTACLDSGASLALVHGLARPDVGILFPDLVNGATSRFAGFLKIPPRLPRPIALRIFAHLADGRQELVFLQRFHPVLTSATGTDLPTFSPLCFSRAVWALRGAGWNAGPATWRASWREFRATAPRRTPPPVRTDPDPDQTRPCRVTLVTHNLNLEGAPLIAFELARHLASLPGWQVRVVSPRDGPLRTMMSDANLPVTLVDTDPLFSADTETDYDAALDLLAVDPVWSGVDVIIANTMVTTWVVHLARRLGRPSLLYVQESVSARRFFAMQLTLSAVMRVEQAFTLATRVAFPAHNSQLAHAALARRGNFRVLPGWIDVARIQAYAAAHAPSELRRAHGLPTDAVIFANIGSILPRKGQHVFLAAIVHLRRHLVAAPPLAFLIVGARKGPDPFTDLLRHAIATQSLPGVRLIDQAEDSYQFFQLADICVCSSLEEAFPRVVLEAAAFGRPIVSTNVNGIPEMLADDEAWLVPPDDAIRLAGAMEAALEAHLRSDRTRPHKARASVTTRFASATLLPRHADLVRTVAAFSHP